VRRPRAPGIQFPHRFLQGVSAPQIDREP
jgi:hypothetical protein